MQKAIDAGDTGPRSCSASLRRLSTQLSAAQVGITLTTLVLGFIATPSIGELLETPLGGAGLAGATLDSVSAVLALVIATLFSMVFGELLPQFLGISAPLATAKVVAMPVRVFALVARPLIVVLNGSANLFLRASASRRRRSCPAPAPRRSWPRWCAARPRRDARRGHRPAGRPSRSTSVSRPRPT